MALSDVPEWGQVLRALVYDAHDARGSDEFLPACREIIDAHIHWPLAEAAWYLDAAKSELGECRDAEEAEALEWYRSVGVAA